MRFLLLFSLMFLVFSCSESPKAIDSDTPSLSTSGAAEDPSAKLDSRQVEKEPVASDETSVDIGEVSEEQVNKEEGVAEKVSKMQVAAIKTEDNVQKNEVAVVSEKEIAKTMEEIPMPTNVPLKPNHDNWDALLRANVSSSGKVNYSAMKASSKELEKYITYLQSFATRTSWSSNEKLAFWINLYNAATVRLIVQNYPIASITKLSGGKPWDQNVVKVGNSSYSLNDIENNIIRPKFKDGRIHFAVNCAAKSCPPLMNKAFTSGSLSRYLEKQTKAFINSNSNTFTTDKIEISKIFDWYKVDFEGGDVIKFLNKYSETPISANAEISYKEYNWDLNK